MNSVVKKSIFIFFLSFNIICCYSQILESDKYPLSSLIHQNIEKTNTTGRAYYIDPLNGSMSNNGSKEFPWSTLEDVISSHKIQYSIYREKPYLIGREKIAVNPNAPVRAGDSLVLLSGDHGKFDTGRIGFYIDEDYLSIVAAPDHTPILTGANINSSSNIYFEGILFERTIDDEYDNNVFINISNNNYHGESNNIVIDNCQISTKGEWEQWDEITWSHISNGIIIRSENIKILNCRIVNINFGIIIEGENCIVHNNIINRFSGDGVRGCQSNLLIQENIIKNSYKVNENHDDGFQSFLINNNNEIKNVIIKDNLIVQSTDRLRPFQGTFQGIGCFDGPFNNWIVEDNIVITDHWHGITLLGANNSIIRNNIVFPLNWYNYERNEGPPRISLLQSKRGDDPIDSKVYNNISTGYLISSKVDSHSNIELKETDREQINDIIKDYENYIFEPIR